MGLALALPAAGAAQDLRQGGEFQVNTYTGGSQRFPVVAVAPAGDFVVAWPSSGQDGSLDGVFLQRFTRGGSAVGSELQVNLFTNGHQRSPNVAATGSGGFVIVWHSELQDGSQTGIFARRFSSAGVALAVEFQVNTYTASSQRYPALAVHADGRFVVAWGSQGEDGSGYGLFARRFSSGGAPLASEFQVSLYTAGKQAYPSVAMDADGDFIVAWESEEQDGSGTGAFARRYTSAGVALGAEFQVNTYTIDGQSVPAVAAAANGAFVIAWESAQDGANYGIFARRFSSAGAPVAAEFRVNAESGDSQRGASVAAQDDGDFVVVWHSMYQDGDGYGIFARRFTSAGLTLGPEIQVNTYTPADQDLPRVELGDDGSFVVVWGSDTQDGGDFGVFAQRFAVPVPLDVDGDGSAQPLTDGLLLLRYLFGFRGATLIAGAVGGSCSRCDAPSIEAFLAVPPPVQGIATPETRLGAEFQVNGFTASYQFAQSVAGDGDSDFVVTWASDLQDGASFGVFGRRFSSAGVRLASEFQLTSHTVGPQSQPSVTAEASGEFVAVWQSQAQDGLDYGIFARRFASTGSPLAGELQVNTFTSGAQTMPALAADLDGDFVVAWESDGQDGAGRGVFARRFASAGAALAAEFQVNLYTADDQGVAAAAMDADGDFVIVWRSDGQDGSLEGIFGRRFSSAGSPLTAELQINSHTSSRQTNPAVVGEADGDFAVAWESYEQDGSSAGIFARRFSSAGAALTGEFQVNGYTTQRQTTPALAALDDGTFVVSWTTIYQDGSFDGVAARRITSTGVAPSPEFQVNTYTVSNQRVPRLAAGPGQRFVVAWNSLAQDGSELGVFAQRFAFPIVFDIDGNFSLDALTDGLLALRYLFGFRGATLITGAIGAGCSRCDAPAIEAYLASLVG